MWLFVCGYFLDFAIIDFHMVMQRAFTGVLSIIIHATHILRWLMLCHGDPLNTAACRYINDTVLHCCNAQLSNNTFIKYEAVIHTNKWTSQAMYPSLKILKKYCMLDARLPVEILIGQVPLGTNPQICSKMEHGSVVSKIWATSCIEKIQLCRLWDLHNRFYRFYKCLIVILAFHHHSKHEKSSSGTLFNDKNRIVHTNVFYVKLVGIHCQDNISTLSPIRRV